MPQLKLEQTLAVLKPDALQRSLVGEIIKRFENVGLKLVAIKMFIPDADFIETHYTFDPEWKRKAGEKKLKSFKEQGITATSKDPLEVGELILTSLKSYLSSGPIIAMVWQGGHAVGIIRKLVGGTEPLTSDVGTIRGDFVHDSYEMSSDENRAIRNLVHASGSVEEALQEIPHWFNKNEIIDYCLVQEAILYNPISK